MLNENKIRVLHLINSMDPGGAENLLASQLPYFDYEKFDIIIGNLYGSNSLINNSEKNEYKIADFSNNTKFSYLSFIKIFIYILNNKIDIIHTHLVQSSLIGRFISLLIPSLKCITTRHYASESKSERFINKIENITLKYSSVIVCISNYVRNFLLEKKIPMRKMVTIYNGIDLAFFNKSSEIASSNKIIIGTIGRLSKQKGVDILLKSFKKILAEYNENIELQIIGDGELKQELINFSNELGISQNVNFTGRISPKDVRKLLNRWEIFVLASRWEAFGIVLIEAMAMEKAIVTTNAEAIPEIVENEKMGFVCDIDNSNEIAEKILLLLNNEEMRIQFGKRGKERVKERFNIKKIVKEIEELYIKVVNNEQFYK
jgi:glycosyltransferase involved in cell wall biosynthesis